MVTDRTGQGLGLFGADQRRVLPHLLASLGDMSSFTALYKVLESRVYSQFHYQVSVPAETYERDSEVLDLIEFTILDVVRSSPPSNVHQLPPSERRLFDFHLSPLNATWQDVLRHNVYVQLGRPAPKLSVSVLWRPNEGAFSAVVGDLERLVIEWRLRKLGCSYEVVEVAAPETVWTGFLTELYEVCTAVRDISGVSSSAVSLASVLGVVMQMFSDPGPVSRPAGDDGAPFSDLDASSPVSLDDLADAVLAGAPVESAHFVTCVSASLAGDPFKNLGQLLDVVYDRFSFSVRIPVDDYARDPGALTVVGVTADDIDRSCDAPLPLLRRADDFFEVLVYVPGSVLSQLDYSEADLAREDGKPLPVRSVSFSWSRDGDCMSTVVGSASARVLLWTLESLPFEYTFTMEDGPTDRDFRFVTRLVSSLLDFRSSPVPDVFSPVARLILFTTFFAAYAPAGFPGPVSPAPAPGETDPAG